MQTPKPNPKAKNATKYGPLGVNPTMPNENAKSWRRYRDDVLADLGCVGTAEETLGARFALLAWREARCYRAQSEQGRNAYDDLTRETKTIGSNDSVPWAREELELVTGTHDAMARLIAGDPEGKGYTGEDFAGIVYAFAGVHPGLRGIEEGEDLPGSGVRFDPKALDGCIHSRVMELLQAAFDHYWHDGEDPDDPEDDANMTTVAEAAEMALDEVDGDIRMRRASLDEALRRLARFQAEHGIPPVDLWGQVERIEAHTGAEMNRTLRMLHRLQSARLESSGRGSKRGAGSTTGHLWSVNGSA